MTFPLVLLPKRVVYVDDNGKFLNVLQQTQSDKHSREFFNAPHAALMALTQEAAYWEGITGVLCKSHVSRVDGKGEAAHYVSTYFNDWRRFNLTGVLIVDYGMPGMHGLQLIEKLNTCPTRRVLLTGEADADIAINAFNAGLIQKFIPKSTPDLHKEITRSYEEMHQSVCQHIGHLIRPTLTTEQLEILHDVRVADGLRRRITELEWTEYVTVGEPFGLLGMALDGPLQWLQIETPQTMKNLAEAASSYDYPAADVEEISKGLALGNWEIYFKLGIKGGGVVDAEEICSSPTVLIGVSDLPLEVLTGKDHGIDDILSPEELMRAMIRNVRLALKHVAMSVGRGDQWSEAKDALQKALLNLADVAALSEFHKQALQSCLAEFSPDDPVRGEIDQLHAARR